MCDLLWSDPEDREGFAQSPRMAGFVFGHDVSEEFCQKNKLMMIARAHQCIGTGYTWCHNKRVCTIFSAPNYCYRCANEAAFMEVNEYLQTTLYNKI